MAIVQVSVQRYSIISAKPLEKVLKKLEAEMGHPDTSAFAKAVSAAEGYGELEAIVQKAVEPKRR
jgi:hypothetical protein